MGYNRNPQTIPDDTPGGSTTRQAVKDQNSEAIDNLFSNLNIHSNNEDGLSHVEIDAKLQEIEENYLGEMQDLLDQAEDAKDGAETAEEGAEESEVNSALSAQQSSNCNQSAYDNAQAAIAAKDAAEVFRDEAEVAADRIPEPQPGDVGKGLEVNATEDGYDIVPKSSPQTPLVSSSVLANWEQALSLTTADTLGFTTVLYTGNGTSQDIVTDIDSVDFTVASNGSGYRLDRAWNVVRPDDSYTSLFNAPSAASGSNAVFVDDMSKFSIGDFVTIYDNTGVSFIGQGEVFEVTGGYVRVTGLSYNRTSGNEYNVTHYAESGSSTWSGARGISKVHIKSRSLAQSHLVMDGLRGYDDHVYTDLTNAEASFDFIDVTATGFTIKSGVFQINALSETYVAYQELYTHVKWGTTNQGKFYLEAFNPVSGRGCVYYIGSGLVGHQIPHSQGEVLNYLDVKKLDGVADWISQRESGKYLVLNSTAVETSSTTLVIDFGVESFTLGTGGYANGSGGEFITYYRRNTDSFKIVEYTGTGSAGNYVELGFKPSAIKVKRLNDTGDWTRVDNQRVNKKLLLNESAAEYDDTSFDYVSSGVVLNGISPSINAVGGEFIMLAEADTKSNGGGSYFPMATDGVLNVNSGIFNYSKGLTEKGYDLASRVVTKSIDTSGIPQLLAKTEGFVTKLYEGNGTSQDVVTGINSVDFTVANNGSGYYHNRDLRIIQEDTAYISSTPAVEAGGVVSSTYVDDISKFSVGQFVGISGNAEGHIGTGVITSLGLDYIVYDGTPYDRIQGNIYNVGIGTESGTTDWGDDQTGVSKVHIKSRDIVANHQVSDGLRGVNSQVFTNLTNAESTLSTIITSFNTNGFSIGSNGGVNNSGSTYVAYQELFPKIKWGTTNQGEFYVEAYNPTRKSGILYYIGSGVADHQIPHSQGETLSYFDIKNLGSVVNWVSQRRASYRLKLNDTDEEVSASAVVSDITDSYLEMQTSTGLNSADLEHICYYKANSSRFIAKTYIGTGASGNSVELGFKPTRVVIKALSAVAGWYVADSQRSSFSDYLYFDTSDAEASGLVIEAMDTGFTISNTSTGLNAIGQEYLVLAEREAPIQDGYYWYSDNEDDTESWFQEKPSTEYTEFGVAWKDGEWYQDGFLMNPQPSFIPQAIQVLNGDVVQLGTDLLPVNVIPYASFPDGVEIYDTILANGLPTVDPFIKGVVWNDNGALTISGGV